MPSNGPRRTPVASDFPGDFTLSIIAPPSSASTTTIRPRNILLLLHGLGDTHIPFSSLALSLNLPETLCISLRAPFLLPLDLGAPNPHGSFHWGDDVVFDPVKPDGGMDIEGAGYSRSVEKVKDHVVKRVLTEKCGYSLRDVLLLGMGQGATVALGVARALTSDGTDGPNAELGGIVCLGGALPDEWRVDTKKQETTRKCKTPVVCAFGRSASAITDGKARDLKAAFEFVELVQWKRAGDGMAKSREEMLPIMKFFARRLRSRAGVPQGAVEIA